ncbi:LemA family protein [uncultured Thalassolituus sp.]|uniref:LemA family protein n=1 Tax=uncultured Thalassolituus sp. TaxID=285273 RepID=UPI00261326E6|nr:LemA family protein [uncultured Thalassolituus sp.]
MSTSAIITLIVVALVVIGVISIYNRLVALKNRYQNSFAQIDVQLKRRYDLIPNLVETAKAYIKHERETLEAVIAARNEASSALAAVKGDPANAGAMGKLIGGESLLANALGRLNVVMEAYPDLKANENMMQVSEELSSTENRIAFARQAFNDSVMEYNTYRESFPTILFAGSFGHRSNATLLEFENRAALEEAPKISF